MAATLIKIAGTTTLALTMISHAPRHLPQADPHTACVCPSHVKPVCTKDGWSVNECVARCKGETDFTACASGNLTVRQKQKLLYANHKCSVL